jgi:hypothetical protein
MAGEYICETFSTKGDENEVRTKIKCYYTATDALIQQKQKN